MTLGDKIKTFLPALLLTLAGFLIAYQFVDPAPPKTITISSGSESGAYHAHALAYARFLKGQGIDVQVQPSAGSVENLARLNRGDVDIAFVQSGIAKPDRDQLNSLGSVYFEPLWVFVRQQSGITSLNKLKGKEVAIGVEGSGTRALALELLGENGVTEENSRLLAKGGEEAVAALKDGKVDALFIVASATAETVWQLHRDSSVRLLDFDRADAYTRRLPTLSALTLPEGALDLASNRPSEDMQLLAATATLLVRPDLHPALQGLLMQAVVDVHGGRSLFSTAGEFPTARYSGMPLSEEAERFYKSGPPLLQRFLPFWAATLVDRLKVMLLPFIALLLPLMKVMPPLYRWRVRSRIYRWYDDLNRIDLALGDGADPELLAELDRIEMDIRKVHVPLSYADELYNLRLHLRMIRESAMNQRESL